MSSVSYSQQAVNDLRSKGYEISPHVESVASNLKVDWAAIAALVAQYGPVVISVLGHLLSGTPAGELITKYGPIAIAVIETILGRLVTPVSVN